MTTLYIGIDPGSTGAVAFLRGDEAWGEVMDTKDGAGVADLIRSQLREGFRVHAAIEKVHSMPGNAASSMFKFGEAFGVPKGVLQALQIPLSLVSPKDWNDRAFRDRKRPKAKQERKEAARVAATELWPAASLTRKKDQAVAEALWMALVLRERG